MREAARAEEEAKNNKKAGIVGAGAGAGAGGGGKGGGGEETWQVVPEPAEGSLEGSELGPDGDTEGGEGSV